MTEHFKAPEIIQLSSEQKANLSDAQFKILVIRKLTELVEFDCKLDEKMKATQSEIKQNVQGTNSNRKEARTQSNDLEQKEETSNWDRMKKQEFKKMRTGLETSGTTLNIPISNL